MKTQKLRTALQRLRCAREHFIYCAAAQFRGNVAREAELFFYRYCNLAFIQ
jgi:hypothetical protein